MKREISERRYRNQKQLDTKKQPETRVDGAEKSISETQMVGLRPLLHHQYPPPRWYHRMPPRQHFQATSTHPRLSAKSARLCHHRRKTSHHRPPDQQPISPENRPRL